MTLDNIILQNNGVKCVKSIEINSSLGKGKHVQLVSHDRHPGIVSKTIKKHNNV